jgi:hypothetical protein
VTLFRSGCFPGIVGRLHVWHPSPVKFESSTIRPTTDLILSSSIDLLSCQHKQILKLSYTKCKTINYIYIYIYIIRYQFWLDAGVMEAITKGPAFGDEKTVTCICPVGKIQGHLTPEQQGSRRRNANSMCNLTQKNFIESFRFFYETM